MRTLAVKRYEEFQHYKDRSPPWIKFHATVLDDYALGCLPDASKAHLFAIWLLASRYGNRIPYDAEWIERRINATQTVDLERLIEAGFLAEIQEDSSASEMLAECLPRDRGRDREELSSLRSESGPPAKGRRVGSLDGDIIDDTLRAWAAKRAPDVDLELLLEKFRNWHRAKGKTRKDYRAAFRNWCLTEQGQVNERGRPAETEPDDHAARAEEIATRLATRFAD